MQRLETKRSSQFLIILFVFLIHGIGIYFKVMVLVEGFTEVRPVNAVPVPAGLFFGPVAGLACAVGNLIADCFGQLAPSSVVGFIGNFMAAYLPFRLWYLYTDEEPNVHSAKNLLIYVWITFVAAIAVAWMIGSLLWTVFGVWTDSLSFYIFMNDFWFPLIFGLPVFIVMTSPTINIVCAKPVKSLVPISNRKKRFCVIAYAIVLTVIFVVTHFGIESMKSVLWFLYVPAAVLTLILML